MDTFHPHLTDAADSLVPDTDPDGAVARHALALAALAAPSAHDALDVGPMADWDLFAFVIGEAEQMLSADLDPLDVARLPPVGRDTPGLRAAVVTLVRRLATLYTAAAAGEHGSPWRRLVCPGPVQGATGGGRQCMNRLTTRPLTATCGSPGTTNDGRPSDT